jgi:hypothetical protein
MRKMAQLDANGIVTNIIVAGDDWDVEGFVEYTDDNPAYIGGTYTNGRFIPPKPSDDAVLDEETGQWIAPAVESGDSLGADSVA